MLLDLVITKPLVMILAAAFYAVAATVGMLVFIEPVDRLVVLTLSGCVLLALVKPFSMARATHHGLPGTHGPVGTALRGMLGSIYLIAASLGAGAIVTLIGGTQGWKVLLGAHVFLASYLILIVGLFLFFRPLIGPALSQIVLSAVLFAAMASLFFINGFIFTLKPTNQGYLIDFVLIANPLTAVGPSLFGIDVLRMGGPAASFYDKCVIADYFHVYPSWHATVAAYAITGAVFGGIGFIISHLRLKGRKEE